MEMRLDRGDQFQFDEKGLKGNVQDRNIKILQRHVKNLMISIHLNVNVLQNIASLQIELKICRL